MAVTYSEMIELGAEAPSFDLPVANPEVNDDGNKTLRLEDFTDADVLVVVFTCNHCPYAKHVEDPLIRMARELEGQGVAFVAISSNDPTHYPDDSFESMGKRAKAKAYPFPYLFDETQEVARAYHAVCTPDFFVFDRDRRLAYTGRFDESSPGRGTATGEDLRTAIEEVLDTGKVTIPQHPSMGCNIKWKPGNEPS